MRIRTGSTKHLQTVHIKVLCILTVRRQRVQRIKALTTQNMINKRNSMFARHVKSGGMVDDNDDGDDEFIFV